MKIHKFLLERFHAKITVIEESKDLDSIPLTELIGIRVSKGWQGSQRQEHGLED